MGEGKSKYMTEVRAGLGGENSDVYCYVTSPVPNWAKSVDDPKYRALTQPALEAAKTIVREIHRDITLKLLVDER